MTFRGRLPASSFTPLASLRTVAAGRPARSEGHARTPERKPHSVCTHSHSHTLTHTLAHTLQKAGCVARSGPTSLSHIHPHGRKCASQPRRRDQSPGSSSVRKERQREGERAGGHSGADRPTTLPGRAAEAALPRLPLQALRTGESALVHS